MQNDVKSCNTIYSIDTGLEMGVTDEFLVKFNEDVSIIEIEDLNKRFGIEIIKTTDIYQLLKVPAGSDALEIANLYQESGLTRFSYPNFICEIKLHQVIPNDSYFVNQFSLHNTGQVFTDGHSGTVDADIDAPEAWSITKGNNNIIIAVLDAGVTSDHPDLPNTRQVRLNGSNFADGNANNPSPTGNNNHGNACAGIVGATQNNNQGISGIAPNCRIMPIRMVGVGVTHQDVADAIKFAMDNGAHIISNSWGYETTNPNYSPAIRDEIIAATTQGRNELGCIVIFSSGNSADHVDGDNGYIVFPANVNVAGVLTIGASDRYDLQANYSPTSNPGSPNNQIIDMVAPSHRAFSYQIPTETKEIWTIDIPGDNGYNPVHVTDGGALPVIGSILPNSGVNYLYYTGRFGATSYACPEVAGVAALLLSINPSLTQLQVFDILTSTADRVGGYVYTNGRSNELGFGRLNACEAVTQAMSTLTISGPTIVCTSNSTFTLNNVPLGVSVNWNVYPPNVVTPYSGTGSTATFHATCNQIGNCNLYYTITSICGSDQVSKSLISGGPDPYVVS
jgi:subtilisin family serine protease